MVHSGVYEGFLGFPVSATPKICMPHITHTIHVWYVYLHWLDFLMVNVGNICQSHGCYGYYDEMFQLLNLTLC